MKTLYLLRHAKSSWSESGIRDNERPLNKRGKRDASFMGKILFERGIKPDKLITSSAVRSIETAKQIAKEINIERSFVIVDERLYHPSTLDFLRVISEIDNSNNETMLISHNPGITDFVNFVSTSDFDNVPTCGVVCIQFDVNDWKDISNHKGKVIFFEYPKKYLK
jgi:phosphohistidine phosphatase